MRSSAKHLEWEGNQNEVRRTFGEWKENSREATGMGVEYESFGLGTVDIEL
jgi:hypothetical protein